MSKKLLSIVISVSILVLFFSFIRACSGTEGESSSVSTSAKLAKEAVEKPKIVTEENFEGEEKEIVEESASSETTKTSPLETAEEEDKKNSAEIKYEIIHTLNLRLDDTITYYVLIDPIDLSNDSFKEDIKEIIRKIVEEKGEKIDIEIFDKRSSLENGYKNGEYDAMADLEKLEEWENWFTDEIINDLAIHSIATYDGELDTGLYYNTLWYFIYSDYVENTIVDKYAETIEFNPYTEASVVNSGEIEEELEINEKDQQELSSLLEKVKISCEVQDIYYGELKVVVWVKNDSDKTFSGYIMIEFYDHKNKIIWQDWSSYTWDFKTVVPPGQSKYCIMWIPLEKGYPVGIKSRVKDYNFY